MCWGSDEDGLRMVPPGAFVSIVAGERHVCALREDGAVACWGSNEYAQATPPPGEHFLELRAAGLATCGLRDDLAIRCWGSIGGVRGIATPAGRFRAFDLSRGRVCALRTNGALACFATDGEPPPGHDFASVVIGGTGSMCGVTTDGSVRCSGFAIGDAAPSARFRMLDGHWYDGICGITDADTPLCFGFDRQSDPGRPPAGSFMSIETGRVAACAIDANHAAHCWGRYPDSPSGPIESMAIGEDWACGLRPDGSVTCWGNPYRGQAQPPTGAFEEIASGTMHSCARRADGSVVCWGDLRAGLGNVPTETAIAIAAGGATSAAVLRDHRVVFWGVVPRDFDTASQRYASVSVASHLACGVTTSGRLRCGGDNAYGLDVSAVRDATEVAIANEHVVARRRDGTLASFARVYGGGRGAGGGGMVAPEWASVASPSGRFERVVATGTSACGVRIAEAGGDASRGSLECWAPRDARAVGTSPPRVVIDAVARSAAGPSVVASERAICAIRPDRSIACVGPDDYGQAHSPTGAFRSVAPGDFHGCAIRDDGSIACWGGYGDGRAL